MCAAAQAYCTEHYDRRSESGRDVYLSLLKVYLVPQAPFSPKVDAAARLHEARGAENKTGEPGP